MNSSSTQGAGRANNPAGDIQAILTIATRTLHRHTWAPEPEVTLDTELDCDVDRASIAFAVEEEILGHTLPEHIWRGWQRVGCIAETVERFSNKEVVDHG